jgi:sugar lactone lactonase YvrE
MNLTSKKVIFGTILFALFCAANSSTAASKKVNTTDDRIVVANVGFKTPESIEYYPAEDVYLVSNINGDGLSANGNGFISKIKPDGSVTNLKWLDGTKQNVLLNAPKGLAIQGNLLYVADINQVHIFELPSGKQRKSITIKNSTFLNGITPGSGDFVYVTDSDLTPENNTEAYSSTDAIYKVSGNGKYKLIVKDKNMGHPNGIIADGKELTVVTFVSGELFRIDPQGKRHELPKPPKGALDGLLRLKDGRLIMSSWAGSALYILNKDNTYSILADSLDAPADLGFDPKRQRVLIPLFKQNQLVFLPL